MERKRPDDAIILKMWAEGIPMREIGDKFGVSASTVNSVLRSHNAPRRQRGRRMIHPNERLVERMFHAGKKQKEIAAALNVLLPIVRRVERKLGLVRPPGGIKALSEGDKRKICILAERGTSTVDLANLFDRSIATIQRVLRRGMPRE